LENGKWEEVGGTAVGRAVFVFGRGKKGFQHRGHRGATEFTENRMEKSGKFVALERKSPPLQTKGGAPSSSIVQWRNGKNPRRRPKAALTDY
jgi:hypothetical protein